MYESLDKIILQRCAAMPAMLPMWRELANQLAVLPEDDLVSLLAELPSLRCGQRIARLLARENDPAGQWKDFMLGCQASDESIAAWLAALDVLLEHTEKAHQPSSLSHLAGYLHCCLAVVESGPRYADFPQTVSNLLEIYGYAGE